MGIVAKQSILNTIFTYIGFIFGAANTLFFYTYFFTKEQYGIVSYLTSSSNLLWAILAFGMQNTIVKFYYTFNTKKEKQSFFSLALITPLFFAIIYYLGYYLSNEKFSSYFLSKNESVLPYVWTLPLIALFTCYFELFYTWAKVHLKSVIGNLIQNIYHRVLISCLMIFTYFGYLNFSDFIIGLVFVYFSRSILMFVIASKIEKINFRLTKLPINKPIITYSFFILITALVSRFLFDMDVVMLEKYISIEKIPIYTITMYFASVIAVPTRALMHITSPLTADFLAKKDFKALSLLNKKASINNLFISGAIALLIIINCEDLFSLIPKDYNLYLFALLLISTVRLIEASLGITNSILLNSEVYKHVMYLSIFSLVLAYLLNLYFIPKHGITGAAVATFIVYLCYNLTKVWLTWKYFNLQPFQNKSIIICLLLISLGIGLFYISFSNNSLLNIILKSGVGSTALLTIITKTNITPDLKKGLATFFSGKKSST